MAQQAEHVLGKDEVTGSNPVISSKNALTFRGCVLFYPRIVAQEWIPLHS